MPPTLWTRDTYLARVSAVEARDFLMAPPAPLVPFERHPRMGEVRALAAAGQKIEAIKLYREITGLGLKDSKDAVDKM